MKLMLRTTVLNFLSWIAIAAALAVTNSLSYHDEQEAERRYCEYVSDHVWPAYDDDIDCNHKDTTQ